MLADKIPLHTLSRVLVIKLRHHGDVLLTSPVFSVLKNHAPQLEIDALVYADTTEMLSEHPAISQIHSIDRRWKKLSVIAHFKAEWALLQALRARRYELVVHLTDHPRGAWIAWLCALRFAVAKNLNKRQKGFKKWLWQKAFTHFFAAPTHALRHAVELNLDALRRIGVYPDAAERRLTLVAGQAADARVADLLAALGLVKGLAKTPFIHIHPASRWHFKCWPAPQMAALINRLHADGHRVLLTAAPDAAELAMLELIFKALERPALSLAGQLSLKELGALTARAQLFIGVDSAPMHMAAAMNTPLVALFGPSGDHEWGPWMCAHRVISSDVHPCRPCGLDGCGGGKVSDCLATIKEDRVYQAVQALLAGN